VLLLLHAVLIKVGINTYTEVDLVDIKASSTVRTKALLELEPPSFKGYKLAKPIHLQSLQPLSKTYKCL
jgi:hypothetical protein